MEEMKAVKMKFEGGKLFVEVDPNKDGQVAIKLELDLSEVADEILAAFKK